jgi:hypothetical protein
LKNKPTADAKPEPVKKVIDKKPAATAKKVQEPKKKGTNIIKNVDKNQGKLPY